MEERAKTAKAERARQEAEARCLAAERERAVYRLLARRWQSRLNALLSQRHESEQGESEQYQHQAAEDLINLLDAGTGQNNNSNAVMVQISDRSSLAELRSIIRGRDINSEDEEDSASEDEDGVIDMEEDHSIEEEIDEGEEGNANEDEDLLEFLADANESVTSGRNRNNSVVMEDVNDLVATGQRNADQPRTVSISSYDL